MSSATDLDRGRVKAPIPGQLMSYASRLQRITRFCLAAIMLLTASTAAIAKEQRYWVTGSYTDKTIAIAKLARLTTQTGLSASIMPTVVSGVPYYRVVVKVSADREAQNQLKARLGRLGVKNPWLLMVQEPDAPDSQAQDKQAQIAARPSQPTPPQSTQARATISTKSPSLPDLKPSGVRRDAPPASRKLSRLTRAEMVDMARYPTKKSFLMFCAQRATAAQRARYCTDNEFAKVGN